MEVGKVRDGEHIGGDPPVLCSRLGIYRSVKELIPFITVSPLPLEIITFPKQIFQVKNHIFHESRRDDPTYLQANQSP